MATFKTEPSKGIAVQKSFNALSGDDSGTMLVQGVGEIVDRGIEIGQKVRKNSAISEVEEEIEKTGAVVATINEAMEHSQKGAKTFDPVRGDTLHIPDAPQEFNDRLAAVMKESGDEFRSISSAVAQGAVPKMAAAVQIEAKLKELTAQYPEFSDELRSTARSLTGYDPTGFHLKQILDISSSGGSKSKTFAEKQEEEAQYISDTLGVDINIVRDQMATELWVDSRRKIRENAMTLGEMEASDMIIEDISETGPYMGDFFGTQMQLVRNGGVVNPEEQALALAEAKAQHRLDLINSIRKGGGKASMETMKFVDSELNKLYGPIEESIKNNDLGKILERKNQTLLQLDKQYGRKLWPRLTRMNNALGERLTGTILDQMASFSNTGQWQLYAKQQPLLWEAIQGAHMSPQDVSNKAMDVYEKVLLDQNLTSEDMPWLRGVVEPAIMDKSTDPEARKKYLDKWGKVESRGAGWLSQPGKRQVASKMDVEWMKHEFKETVPQLSSAIAQEIVSDPNVSVKVVDGKLRMVKTIPSTVSLKGVPVRQKGEERIIQNARIDQLQYYINAANNGWAGDFGVDAKSVLKDITNQITQEANNLEGTGEPSFIEQLGEEAASQLKSVGDFILKSHREYEDIVNGRRKAKSGNELLQEWGEKINAEIERMRLKGVKQDESEK